MQILMGFILKVCRFCLCNRHIQANKVSLAPYGDSKQ